MKAETKISAFLWSGMLKNNSFTTFLAKYLVDNSKITTFVSLKLNKAFYESSKSQQDPSGLEA